MRAFLPKLPFGATISTHFKGLFYSIVLPTSAAQDIVRAAMLSRQGDYSVVWGATWVCRLLGLFVLAVLSLAGFLLIDSSLLPGWLSKAIGAAFAAILLFTTLSFSKKITRFFRPVAERILPEKVMQIADNVRQAIYLYRHRPGRMLMTFAVTVLVQLLVVLNAVILAKAITGSWYIIECLFFIPAIEIIVVSLPLTPNGMGLREGLLSLFLISFLGFSAEQVGVYVLLGFSGILLRVVGAVPVAYDFVRKR
jgi:hypothetical protein